MNKLYYYYYGDAKHNLPTKISPKLGETGDKGWTPLSKATTPYDGIEPITGISKIHDSGKNDVLRFLFGFIGHKYT